MDAEQCAKNIPANLTSDVEDGNCFSEALAVKGVANPSDRYSFSRDADFAKLCLLNHITSHDDF